MDANSRMRSLLASTSWVRSPELALQLLPELATDAPPLVALGDQRTDGEPVIPALEVAAIAAAVVDTLLSAGAAATGNGQHTSVEDLDEAALRADPLVEVLRAQLVGAAIPGLNRVAVPALAVAWTSARALSGQDLGVVTLDRGRATKLSGLSRTLSGLAAADRGAALSTLSWELSGRLAAALQLARAEAPGIADNALMRRIVTDPLTISCARGTLDETPDMGLLGAVIGVTTDPASLTGLDKVVGAALRAIATRRSKGKAGPLDFAVSEQIGDLTDPARVLHHPTAGPLVMAAMPDLVTAKELKSAGVPADQAKALLKRPGALALAAAWRDVLHPLLSWDLASALVDRVVPLAHDPAGNVRTAGGALRDGARWSLLVPRTPGSASVVAARLTELARGLGSSTAAHRAWATLCETASVPAYCVIADHGVAAFPNSPSAFAFAERARAELSGPRTVTLADGSRRALDAEHAVSVGVAHGSVQGGTDGAQSALLGPAVAEALALSGLGSGRLADPKDLLSIRRAGVSGQGFTNRGLVTSGAFLRGLLEALRRRDGTVHLQGEPTEVGGISADFRLYPVTAWWQHDADIAVAIALTDPPEEQPAVEIQVLDREGFASFHRADAGAADRRSANAPAPAAADPFGEPAGDDPFAANAPAKSAADAVADSVFGFVPSTPAPPPDKKPQSDLDVGLLDAFSHDGATGETPVVAAFEATETNTPLVGQLAMLDEDDEDTSDPDTDGGLTAATIGRLAMVDEDGPAPPVHEEASTDPITSAPMLAIEDEEDEDGWSGDDWDGEGYEDEDEDEDELHEGALVEEFNDFEASRGPELSILQGSFEQASVSEPSDGFAPLEDDPGFYDDEEYTGFQDQRGRAAPGRIRSPESVVRGPTTPSSEAPEGFGDADSLQAGGDDGFGSFRSDPGASDLEPASDGDFGFGFAEPPPEGDPDDDGFGFSFGGDDDEPQSDDAFAQVLAEEPEPAPPAPAPSPADDALLNELVRMFSGYVVFEADGAFTFGLREGELLRDAQRFETSGDVVRAYGRFLQYKIRNGFVTEAHKSAAIPSHATVNTLDGHLLRRAYVEVAH